jgi:copper chaperone CopZ
MNNDIKNDINKDINDTNKDINDINSVRFNVYGLEENETQDRVKNQLEGVVGVKDACTSNGQNYVDIDFDNQTSVKELNNHLQNNGYKVTDIV